MKHIKLFENYYQDLYHYTSVKNLLDILISNEIKLSSYYGNLSLTRNSNFFKIDRGGNMQKNSNQVKIIIDAEKLKKNQKLIPFNHFKRNYNKLKFHTEFDEDEEISNMPINIKYFQSIIIYKNNLSIRRNIFYSTEMNKKTLDILSKYYDLEQHNDHNEYYKIFNDYEILEVIKNLCKDKKIDLFVL